MADTPRAEGAGGATQPTGRRRTLIIAVVVSAAAIVLVALGAWLLTRDGAEPASDASAEPTQTATTNDAVTSSPTSPTSTAPTASATADGASTPATPTPTPEAPPAEPASGLPGAGSLDGYVTLLARRTAGDHSFDGGGWRIDPCSEFSEPAFRQPELVDYLTTRVGPDEVIISVHPNIEGAGALLALMRERVAQCGGAEHSFEGEWTATALPGLGEEALHLHAVYTGDVLGANPAVEYRVFNAVLVRVENVVLGVSNGHLEAAPGELAVSVPAVLRADTEAELAALLESLGLAG